MALRRAIAALALALFACPPLFAADGAPVKVRLLAEQFPPLQYADANGVAHGVVVKLMTAALAELGPSVDIEVAPVEFVPLRRGLQTATLQPNIIVLSVARTPEREKLFQWLGPVSPYELWIYSYKNHHVAPVKDFRQLTNKGLRFGVQTSSNFHEWLLRQGVGRDGENSVVDAVPHNAQNFPKMQLGRVDLFAHPEISMAYRAAENGLQAGDFEKVMLVEELSTPLWAALGKGSDPRLVSALTQQLKKMRQSGQAERLRQEAMREFNANHHLDGK
jgi:polar amino acid transport system substrate-binding protein